MRGGYSGHSLLPQPPPGMISLFWLVLKGYWEKMEKKRFSKWVSLCMCTSIHSPTQPPTHSTTHPLTHSLTQPPSHPPTHPPTQPLTQPPHSPTHSPTHPLTHSLTPSLTHSLTHSPTHSLTHPPTHSLTHSLTYSPTYSTRYYKYSSERPDHSGGGGGQCWCACVAANRRGHWRLLPLLLLSTQVCRSVRVGGCEDGRV